ncbi:MAG TPA: hypothetical protein VNZ26_26095 [Vicinamibacterales bacterium]|jgi:hypothetical protein|nr:hypothetical protein [Vicinamibacterales bacterium]
MAADAGGRDVVEPWIKAASPSHLALLDPELAVASLYNVRNVPSAFWIDESGRIVRANDPIYVLRRDRATGETSRNETYLDAVRDWVANGPSSRFLADEAALEKRRPPASFSDMEAMASFELGVYLIRRGASARAERHFERARQLAPDNWTFRRQAWSLSGATQETIIAAIRDPAAPAFYPELDLRD